MRRLQSTPDNGMLPALRALSAYFPGGFFSDSLLQGSGGDGERLYTACLEAAVVLLCIQVRDTLSHFAVL
jgi:hypothetical protein